MDEKSVMEHLSNLGKHGRDKVTGFEGVISAVAFHLYGCETYVLTPKAKDNRYEDVKNFDAARIEIISEGINPTEVQAEKPGGEDIDFTQKVE